MIYFTGDMHGNIDRFHSRDIRRLKKGDYLIVCGDFGFLWENTKQEQKNLSWIANRPYTTLFIEGTHENFDLLEAYPSEEGFGGMVRKLGKRLYHLQRGYVFDIAGKKIFAMGGGECDLPEIRKQHSTYWQQEMPSKEELKLAAKNLEQCGYSVDYIVSYEAATTVKSSMNVDMDRINYLNAFLDGVLRECRYSKWFFGSYHIDRKLSGSLYSLFRRVIPAEDFRGK